MGFREDALRAAQEQHAQRDAQKEAERRTAMKDLEKPARKALKNWSKAIGVSPENVTIETQLYGGRYRLSLTWSAEGCEFHAWYPQEGWYNSSEPNKPVVRMKDGGWWLDANTRVEIGQIFSGEARARRQAADDFRNNMN
jgi:hypothetical protein